MNAQHRSHGRWLLQRIAVVGALSIVTILSNPANARHNLIKECHSAGGNPAPEALLRYWRDDAERGDAKAQFCLYSVLSDIAWRDGWETPEMREAINWLRKSAAMGFGPAEEALAGELLHAERGIGPDPRHAGDLMRSAADKGSASANYGLGIWLINGLVPATERTEAYRRLSLALELAKREDDTEMLKMMEHFALPRVVREVGRLLTRRERKQADEWVRNWKPLE